MKEVFRQGMSSARLDAFKASMQLDMMPDNSDVAPKLPQPKKKSGFETVDLKVFDQIAKSFGDEGKPDFRDMIKDAVEVVKAMNIRKGDQILVVSSSPSLWAEAAMIAQGAQVSILEGQQYQADRTLDRFGYMFDQFSFDGVDKLKRMCLENSSADAGNILFLPEQTPKFDHVCMACVLDAPIGNPGEILLKGLSLTKLGGNMVQGFVTPAESTFTSSKMMSVATDAGYKLDKIPCSRFYGDETCGGGIFKVLEKPKTK